MRLSASTLVLLACLPAGLFLVSCSTTAEPPPPATANTSVAYKEGVPGGVFVNTVDVSATVTAIDRTTRKLTLLGPDGDKVKVKVGPDAVNFDQIKVGDMVKATVTQELVVALGDEDAAQADGKATAVALAPKGAQPGAVVAQATQVTGTVVAINLEDRTATLEFEDGTTKTYPVRTDIDLTQQKVGQKVVFQVTEMVAINVQKP